MSFLVSTNKKADWRKVHLVFCPEMANFRTLNAIRYPCLTLIALISRKSAQNQQKMLEKKKSSLGISGNHQLIAIEVKILDKNTSENGSIHVIPEILIDNDSGIFKETWKHLDP